jgi:hypothetical protein
MHIHLPKCNNLERLKCLHCNNIMLYDYTLNEEENYDIHKKNCSLLTISCLYCESLVVKSKWGEHLKICEMNLFYCTQCSDFYPRKFKNSHDEYFCNGIKTLLLLYRDIKNLISVRHFFITESDFI